MADTVVRSAPAPGVALLTLSRPDRLNAMSHELVADLHSLLDEVAADESVRVVVLTGEGRGFCAGLDLRDGAAVPGTGHLGRPQQGMATPPTAPWACA